jgi:4-hydroxy-tetrahydrodipicolinate synthase
MTRTPQRIEFMFNGSIAALVTPFDGEGELDLAAFNGLIDFHLENGTDGLVIGGTTGESATLEPAELETLLEAALRRVDGQIPVLAGTGSASTAAAVRRTQRAAALGVDGVLVVTPYYVRPEQSGLEAHFLAVAEASSVPVVLYNVPSRTAVDLLPGTVEKLAVHARIVGLKEAAGGQGRIEELRARCGPDFALLSGDDAACLGAMRSGADGVVSVAANVSPDRVHALCRAAEEQDWDEAKRLDGRLRPLYEALAVETNPIPVKWALAEMRRIGPVLRLPMTPLDPGHHETVRKALQELDLAGPG